MSFSPDCRSAPSSAASASCASRSGLRFSDVYGAHWLLVAVTVSISLVGVVLWGSLTGSLLPLLLRRLNFDPAVSSAPFVATLVDVTGLVIYFSVAVIVLQGTLL